MIASPAQLRNPTHCVIDELSSIALLTVDVMRRKCHKPQIPKFGPGCEEIPLFRGTQTPAKCSAYSIEFSLRPKSQLDPLSRLGTLHPSEIEQHSEVYDVPPGSKDGLKVISIFAFEEKLDELCARYQSQFDILRVLAPLMTAEV